LGAQLGSIVPGRIDTSPNLFKSSTLGLTDLGKRIQEGAASEHKGQEATDKYLPTMDKSLKDAASALQQFLKLNLGTVK
jgi:hypothetical protein